MTIMRVCLLLFMVIFTLGCQSEKPEDLSGQSVMSEARMRVVLDPDFSWASFMRFWHRGADEKVHLENVGRDATGYFYDYGYGVNVSVPMRGDYVAGVTLTYAAIAGNDSGGRQFLRLIQHVMRLGGFQWEAQQRELLYAYYAVMTPQTKEFYYKNAYFIRAYDAGSKLWTFSFFFVKPSDVVRAIPAL